MSLDGAVALVTGGGGALAGPVAQAFHAAGARLVLVDRVAPADRAAAVGGVAYATDLTDRAATVALVERIEHEVGPIVHVVHTVGGFVWGPAAEASVQDHDLMFDLNVRTLVNVGSAVLPGLQARGAGSLTGIAAGQAWRGGVGGVALYAASKAAVRTWLRSVDQEMSGTDVKVGVVVPDGIIDTPANRAAMPDADPRTWIDPAELAAAMVQMAASGRRGRVLEVVVGPGR